MNKLKYGLLPALLCAGALAWGQVGINGAVEWDKMEVNAVISIDLASTDIKLPSGRIRGEELMAAEYLRLIRPCILGLRADSSSTVGEYVERGEWNLLEAENFALRARTVPPSLSPDFRRLTASYTLNLSAISSALFQHSRPGEIERTLSPRASPSYTGIIIIAAERLPVHGRKGSALLLPCLFPKIWDDSMNLIFERNMLDPTIGLMVRYAPVRSIFRDTPSGLTPEVAALAGERPLRIFARGVFGATPTDPIIDREDALLIISSEHNRRLLREGRLVILVDESALRSELGTAENEE
jgi:hypothetical protein